MTRRTTGLLACVGLIFPAACAAQGLRAGAHAVDITPRTLPIVTSGGFLAAKAERLAGTLHVRCLVLDDGAARIAIAVADSLMMPREMLDRVKEAASRTTGIRPDRMLISADHTHSTPPVMGALGTDVNPEYAAFVEARIVEAIEGAAKNLEPAVAGWTAVDAPTYTHCRRWILRPDKMRKDPFGALTVRAHMHPGYQNPDFEAPAGPVDPALTLLSVRSAGGRPIALLANYSMHYVGAGGGVVSPDYYGPFAENVQRLVGAQDGPRPFIAMMSQGTSGDQHWMDYSRPRQEMSIPAYAEAMAKIAFQAYRTVEYRDRVPIAMAEATLRLRRRVPDAARLAWAKEIVARMAGAPPRNQEEVYGREQMYLAAEPERELKLQALRVGELGIAAIPNEVFGITGLKIKAQSPLRPTLNIELANGAEGYIPPAEQHVLGGYTTWPARTAALETGAEVRITEAVLTLLERVSGARRRPVEEPAGPYGKAVLASKPLAYWRGSEWGGPAARDATRNGNTAKYEGGVALYLEGPASAGFAANGGVNRAPHFAGGRLRAALPRAAGRYSVALWFWNALPAGVRPVTGTLFSTGNGEELLIGGSGKLAFAAGGKVFEGAAAIGSGTWHYVVLVRDRSRVAVYLDGASAPEISGAAPAAASRSAQLVIAGENPASSFEGKIDEIAVWNRALPAAEAASQYAAAGR